MEKKSKDIRVYNVLLPLWLIVFLPTWLWLLLIPANYLIDRVVLWWSLGGMEGRGQFCRAHNWKICTAGFASDFVGALFLFAVSMVLSNEDSNSFLYDVVNGIMMNPFRSVPALAVTAAGIALAALCIFFIDRTILRKAGLTPAQAKKSALMLAVITAPYLYLIPSELLYSNGF